MSSVKTERKDRCVYVCYLKARKDTEMCLYFILIFV